MTEVEFGPDDLDALFWDTKVLRVYEKGEQAPRCGEKHESRPGMVAFRVRLRGERTHVWYRPCRRKMADGSLYEINYLPSEAPAPSAPQA